jgi:hypothetical protein
MQFHPESKDWQISIGAEQPFIGRGLDGGREDHE